MHKSVKKRTKHLFSKSATMLWISVASIIFSSLKGYSQSDSMFFLANKYYQQNDFSMAILTYRRIIENGSQTPEILYNLGNAYYKNGNLGYAILYYEKAKQLAPHDEDINQNLAIANARVLDKIDVIPDFFIKRWIYHLVNLLPSNSWAIVSLITFAVMLSLFMLFFFSGNIRVKRAVFFSATVLLLTSILAYLCSVKRKNYVSGNDTAIVVEPSVSIKSSPDTEGNNVFVLHEGTKVLITDSIENWKEIRLTDGNKGWLESNTLQPI